MQPVAVKGPLIKSVKRRVHQSRRPWSIAVFSSSPAHLLLIINVAVITLQKLGCSDNMQITPPSLSPASLSPATHNHSEPAGVELAAIPLLPLYIVCSFQRIIDLSGTMKVSVFTDV